ncbi:thioredoxin family protein [Nonlabens antarcticus]|uniref:thioredoxin family protein n=1 Tax=Nonlabens antarcticus TaxID=392714 RepID=UPI001890FAED|nr:thioredoxin family protein [Nonlabens antarcticus]
MKYILISFCSLLAISQMNAQQYIMDDEVSTTAVAVDNEMKILYFTATWCGPCRMMKPAIEAIDKDPKSPGKIYKMDIDQNITDDILKVPGVPTFIFLKNGTVIDQHTGAMNDTDLKALIARNAKRPATKELLAYQPVPTKYKVVTGKHPKLTKRNLTKLWYHDELLAQTAASISDNLTDKQDLLSGLSLINRAIEINKSSKNLVIKSNLLSKLGSKKEALATEKEAKALKISRK